MRSGSAILTRWSWSSTVHAVESDLFLRDDPVEVTAAPDAGSGSTGTGRGCVSRLERSAIRVARGTTQIIPSVPLVLDATHQEGAIKLDRASREERLILEEAGPHLLDVQRFHPPVDTPQLQALETRRIACRRVSEGTGLEERGGFFQRAATPMMPATGPSRRPRTDMLVTPSSLRRATAKRSTVSSTVNLAW